MALIYIVEDDESIREIEEISLKNSGHDVIGFSDAASFYRRLESIIPELIVLDVMLPDVNGYDIVKKLRAKEETRKIPMIMVTAKTTELDMVKGLDGGADDYIKKPFSVIELITRVKALLRRVEETPAQTLTFDTLTIDHIRHEATLDGRVLDLTFKEYELLRYLALNKGVVLSRDKIMQTVWGTDYEGESRTVDMHIKTLRKKLDHACERIKTVRNVGYMFE